MSARDELAETIARVREYPPAKLADVILAAGYSKPRTISTVEELDALPDQSVVMGADHEVWRQDRHSVTWWDKLVEGGYIGIAQDIALPATVLYTPQES